MHNLRSVDLNLLTVFEALFAERNLTRAANRIGMSQPGMSNALSRLRFLFKDELFVRQGNSMQPTQRAHQLSVPIGRALAAVREGLSEVEEFNPESPRTFSLAGIEYLDHMILPELLVHVGQHINTIHLKTQSGYAPDLKDRVKSGDIDVVVDIKPINDEEFENLHLANERLVTLVRQGHPKSNKRLSIEETLDLNHAVLEARDEHGYYMERHLREYGRQSNITVKVAHLFSLPLIVLKSDLVCTVPDRVARHFMQRFDLIALDTELPEQTFPLMMIWHNTQTTDPGHTWLREQMVEVCKKL